MMNSSYNPIAIKRRARELHVQSNYALHKNTDHLFQVLMLIQWFSAMGIAILITPRTWIAATGYAQFHVWLTVVVGALLCAPTILMAKLHPGRAITRHAIAISQVVWSGFIIHLLGGGTAAHYHTLASFALLAFYRDWKILLTAGLFVTIDQLIRNTWFPTSLFGLVTPPDYHLLALGAWLTFEVVFLTVFIYYGQALTSRLFNHQAKLESINQSVESIAKLRTSELHTMKEQVASEIDKKTIIKTKFSDLESQFSMASRQAGMTEFANGILHNIGNVISSINQSTNTITNHLSELADDRNDQFSTLIADQDSLDRLSSQEISEQATELSLLIEQQERQILSQLADLRVKCEHAVEIVNTHQSYSQNRGQPEIISLNDLVQDAIRISNVGFERHGIELSLNMGEQPKICTEKHKVLQVMVNLLGNAKDAVKESGRDGKRITIETGNVDDSSVFLRIADNGIGISLETQAKLFQHGYTTKPFGNGFGLHSSMLIANELAGEIKMASEGINLGATFTLILPLEPPKSPTVSSIIGAVSIPEVPTTPFQTPLT